MFKKTLIKMRFSAICLLVIMVVFSCIEEPKLTFSEQALSSVKGAEISIIYPEVNGTTERAIKINTSIENFIVSAIRFSEDHIDNTHIADAVKAFNKEYEQFKTDFPEAEHLWNASIEGEVLYRSDEVITVVMNSYVDTGGAHGNDNINFFNFNAETGDLFKTEDLIKTNKPLNELVKTYLKKEIAEDATHVDDYFFEESFYLPENIGFSEDGVVFLYNRYEGTLGFTEFVIPFNEMTPFLKIQ